MQEPIEEFVGQDQIEEPNYPETESEVTPIDETPQPKKKARTLEELITAAVKSMTDAELKKLVEHLRIELKAAESAIATRENNLNQAYEKVRTVQGQFDNYKNNAQMKLMYVKDAVQNLNNAIKLIGIKEEN